ncbi:MAG: phospholipid carrier-dependent glycosyltransferase [Parcubacteria group bacterium]|nr:phospholipid carrier-dependent glycosyltransferase [Parcubacteria group bacterium]
MLTDTKNSVKLYLFILIGLSLLTRFIFFSYPAETVFDEVHFGKFISAYFTGEYYFDIHPPLGKMMIAGVAKLVNFHPGFSFENIGQKFPDATYQWLRFLPKLFGAVLPVIIFLFALELGISPLFSFLAGLFLVLDNALIAQSRFILLDSFLLVFGFTSLLFYFKSLKKEKILYLLLSGVFAGLAVSIKWTGLTFLGLIFVDYFLNHFQEIKKSLLRLAVFLIFIPLILYFSIFTVHFKLLPHSGPGDAFHTPEFQKTLFGSKYALDNNVKSLPLPKKFIGLNKEMFRANAGLASTHPYASKWYQWPFMTRPIYYWNGAENNNARIYFFGNPFIWWAATVGIIISFLELIKQFWFFLRRQQPISGMFSGPLLILLFGYCLNLLPFIGISRVMFLYHYLSALIFSILILALLLEQNKNSKFLSFPIWKVLLVGAVVFFLIFSPLSYGLPLLPTNYEHLVWFPSWR